MQDIESVNMFMNDNTVVNFKKPKIQFSVRENLMVVFGSPETKELKEMMPDILKEVGPQQYGFLKDVIGQLDPSKGKAGAAEDEDDVPDLVGNFEDASKNE